MKKMLRLRNFLLVLTISIVTWSCSDDDDGVTPMTPNEMNIVETAQAEDALTSLVSALTTADNSESTDLVGTLSGDGPFIVFAPTNDAFTALFNQLDVFYQALHKLMATF